MCGSFRLTMRVGQKPGQKITPRKPIFAPDNCRTSDENFFPVIPRVRLRFRIKLYVRRYTFSLFPSARCHVCEKVEIMPGIQQHTFKRTVYILYTLLHTAAEKSISLQFLQLSRCLLEKSLLLPMNGKLKFYVDFRCKRCKTL